MQKKKFDRHTIVWENVEKQIAMAEADVLAILDCCQAGVLGRTRSRSRSQILGACTAEGTTRPPGLDSFTSALIWALKELHEKEYFPLNELQHQITLAPHFPQKQIPVMADRLHCSPDNIVIAPTRESSNPNAVEPRDDLRGEYVNLRFHFSHMISTEDFKHLADEINRLLLDKRIKARRVAFLGKRSYQQKLAEYTHDWQKRLSIRRKSEVENTGRLSSVVISAEGPSTQRLSTAETAVCSKERTSPQTNRNSTQGIRKRTRTLPKRGATRRYRS